MKCNRFLKGLSAMLAALTVMSLASLPTFAQTAPAVISASAEVETLYANLDSNTTSTLGAGPSYRPIFGKSPGTYNGKATITMSTSKGATIYYTTDGTTPTKKSKKYTGSFKITKSCTIKAIAYKNGKKSGVATADYEIKVSKPTFSVSGGYYTSAQKITITPMDSKTTMYYTTDGSTPTKKSKKYTGPIKVSDYAIISVRAYKSGCTKSDVVTQEYKIYKAVTTTTTTTTDSSERKSIEYKWNDGTNDWTYTASIRHVDYETYYKKQNYSSSKGFLFAQYVTDTTDDAWVESVVKSFMDAADEVGYTDLQKLYMVISFVQSITYKTDKESTGKAEFPKYPLVTLYEGNGDCEDSSILLCSMLQAMGYDCIMLEYSGTSTLEGHMAVGIAGDFSGLYYQTGGKRYFYVETTNTGWDIGAYPEGYNVSAIVHTLK